MEWANAPFSIVSRECEKEEMLVVERGQGEGILDCKSAWAGVRRIEGITGVRA